MTQAQTVGQVNGGRADAEQAEVTAELIALLRAPKIHAPAVAALLDGLGHRQRVAAIRGTGRREQSRLWAAVDGFAPLSLVDVVPASQADNTQVRHFGKNTLPLFTTFEKRFLRPAGQDPNAPTELHGYNYQSSAIAMGFSGPGYFVAVADPKRAEVLIDYRRVPAEHPASWPKIVSNERGGASLVYGYMVDALRRVSEHVTIGRANKHGKDMNAWFMLCRDAS